jgi:hypothetical protein
MKISELMIVIFTFLLAVLCYGQSGKAPQALFHSAPTVRAFAENDPAKVMTIATGDFDHKGGIDIVTVQADGMLNALYNNGEGDLQNSYNNDSAVASKPNITFIAAADLNGDQYLDVVALDGLNSAILVFLNSGDGTFAPATSTAGVPEGEARLAGGGMAAADVNKDGHIDVVTVARSPSAGTTTLLQTTFFGAGDGTFQRGTTLESTLSGAFFLPPGKNISVADMNRDGNSDLVIQLEQNSPRAALIVSVSFGTGDGTFQNITSTGPSVEAGPQPASSVTVDDINGDGLQDVVFLSFRNEVLVALGRDDGSLQNPSPILTQMSGAVLLTLGDVNNDKVLDLLVFGTGELGVFKGNGDGTFRAGAQYIGGYGIFQQPAHADFNGDGNADIAWLDYTNGRVGLYSGKGDGSFAAAIPVRAAGNVQEWAGNTQVITVADLNGDGNQDVLTYDWPHASAGGRADLASGIGDGTGQFHFKIALPAARMQELATQYGSFSVDTNAADFNGDNTADVIFKTQSGLSVLLANADGTLNPAPIDVAFPLPVSCMPFNYIATGDVNGDGFQDIVAAHSQNRNCTPSASTPSGIFVLMGDGTGHFETRFTPFGDAPFFVRLADLNGDQKLDLVVANLVAGNGFTLYIAPGKGDGSFDFTSAQTPVTGQPIGDILLVDYNRDGRQDLVLPTGGIGTAGVLLLPATGDLSFGEPTKILDGVSSITNGAAAGDFDGDGNPDLVFVTYTKAEPYSENFGVIVVRNQGDGTFGPAESELAPLSVGGLNSAVFVADFNRDGAPDVLAGSGLSSPLFLNRGGLDQ